MQNDINTKGCTQWYYFSVINRAKGKVKFRIMNFVRIVIYSVQTYIALPKRNESTLLKRSSRVEEDWHIDHLW